MRPSENCFTFIGPLAEYCVGLYAEKRAAGYHYKEGGKLLRAIDRFCLEQQAAPHALPKELVQRWMMKRTHESAWTHANRIASIRHLALFMRRQGVEAYVPPLPAFPQSSQHFSPHIFTEGEIGQLLAAADKLRPCGHSPRRDRIMPAIFRLLYGCGLRVSEACALRVSDVDLAEGVLTIQGAKFDKDRLVPMTPSLTSYLQRYVQDTLLKTDQYFFPAPDHGRWAAYSIYQVFRTLLWTCGMSHGGKGRGPRLHDLRHTFAVHCLQRWVREGRDLSTALPVLSTYLGHNSLYGTQRYLRLTAALYPDITAAVEARFEMVIPEGSDA